MNDFLEVLGESEKMYFRFDDIRSVRIKGDTVHIDSITDIGSTWRVENCTNIDAVLNQITGRSVLEPCNTIPGHHHTGDEPLEH